MKPYESINQEGDDSDETLFSRTSSEEDEHLMRRDPPRSRWCQMTTAEVLLLSLVVLSNLGWLVHMIVRKSAPNESDYFGSPDKIFVAFDHDWVNLTDEGIGGHRYADEKWEGMFPEGLGSVAVTKDFAALHHLPAGMESTTRPGEMQYLVAGYHQLHCLMEVRDQLYEPTSVALLADTIRRDHILHCVEALRQALYCFLDPTLINLEPAWPHVPNGQMHVCRNRDALKDWAANHKHPLPGTEPTQF